MIRELYEKPILCFGCGNVLFGDDGFGPAVIEHLERHHRLPPEAAAMDVGTSVREFLFDLLLAETRPRLVLVIDAATQPGRRPGELMELTPDGIGASKVNDFSLHQFPGVNMLAELRDLGGVEVRILAVQTAELPDRVAPGLSAAVAAAVPAAALWAACEMDRAAHALGLDEKSSINQAILG